MCSLAQAFRPGSGKFIPASFRSLSEKSRRDAMFIERNQARREEPIYGRKVFGCAPKGASISQFGLVFYKHFAGAPSKAWCFLLGESPSRTRSNQPVVPSVAAVRRSSQDRTKRLKRTQGITQAVRETALPEA